MVVQATLELLKAVSVTLGGGFYVASNSEHFPVRTSRESFGGMEAPLTLKGTVIVNVATSPLHAQSLGQDFVEHVTAQQNPFYWGPLAFLVSWHVILATIKWSRG